MEECMQMSRLRDLRGAHIQSSTGLLCFFAALLVFGSVSKATACDAENPEQYRSEYTIWCVHPQSWTDHQTDIQSFFSYSDGVIAKLIDLFGVQPDNLPYYVVARDPDGGAQTPTRYGPGVEVTADAYWNSAWGVQGYWGYLLTLHEFVNQWTGLVTGGWPTDWWADHRSPFPNSMDWHIMEDLGMQDAAGAQKGRFTDPHSGSYDSEVVMFDDIFDIYGFDGYKQAFGLIRGDGLQWYDLRDPPDYTSRTDCVSGNPSQLLAEYVIAYLSIPARQDLSSMMAGAGVGQVVDGLMSRVRPQRRCGGGHRRCPLRRCRCHRGQFF
jgi:hypothetical protein